ncbi:DUF4347 domain-containing protein, partial [Microcoleus sp. Pol12B5]|uniref:DUF4347 domain-containing protein n=1 Tax=Microcoleus sp. Pol12B5 TaxID=3055396 RepID=UPI002FD1BD5E
MKNLWCNYSSPIHKLSCDRRDTDCIKVSLIGTPLVGNPAINISCLTKASRGVNTQRKKHLVCIDPRVENYQHLASGVKPGTEIIVLDRSLDGVEQITEILAKRSSIASLQIVAHGNEASVQLGSTLLKDENLPKYDRHLQQWRHAFTEKADILILACQVGSGKAGIAFVQKLRELTGANIAASNNLIGSAKLGGNWQLNVTAGRVKTAIAFETKTQETYSAVLISLVDESFQDARLIGPWISGVTGTSDAPALTAGTGTESFPGLNIDPVGSGALRLTTRTFDQSTFVIYNSQVPVNSGLNIVFDIFAYDGTARPNLAGRTGDGISFFLIDGTVTPTVAGGYGGSLGYAQNTDTNQSGLRGGYLGIGLDEFGNFSSETQGRVEGIGVTRRADSVTLRGSESTGYRFLTSTFVPQGIDNIPDTVNPLPPNGPINAITSNREAARRRVQIILQPPNSATPNHLTVNFDLNNNGSFADPGETLIDIANLQEEINEPIPATFKFGFAGSTGDATNIHDVRTLSIQTIDVPLTTADVASTKTGPAAAAPGSPITYTITTVNNGPNDAENVVIEDQLPVGAVFGSADGDGTFNPTTRLVSWSIPNLPLGATATRTVTVTTPTTLGPITNSVFSSSSTIDPVPGNNSGSSPDARVTTTITNDSADVVTVKSGPPTAAAGLTVTYTITAANSGPSAATNVVISDTIVPGLTGVSVSEGGTYSQTTGIVTWPTITSLASAASTNRTVRFPLPATGGPIANTASSTSTSRDPNPDNNNGSSPSARVTTTITDSADVATIKTGPPTAAAGSTVTYTITAANSGPSAATNVVISDTIVPGLTGVSVSEGGTYSQTTGIVTWPAITSLASAASTNRTVRFPFPATGGPIANTASSTSTSPDPNPANNNGSSPSARVTTTITDSADVVTLKTGPATAAAGSTVTYTILTENRGPSTATNITVTDSIVPGLTGVTASNGGIYDPATGIVSFPPIASLADGVTVSRTVRFPVPTTGTVSNTARSTSTTDDPNPANNNGRDPGATVSTSIASAPTPTPTPPPAPTPTPTPANLRPIANNVNLEIAPSSVVAIAGLGGSDPDGSIASFTINTVPPANEGLIFLGNPDTGGTIVTAGQILTPADINQLFFQSTSNFTTANFTYSATDNQGATSRARATVSALDPVPNKPPVANNVDLDIAPSSTVLIAGLGGTDPDGSIASFTINTVPPANEGLIFLGNPDIGGRIVTAGQILTPADINQLFFQSTANFTTANFTYSATDNQGAISPASATVSAIPLNEPTPTPTPTPIPTPTPAPEPTPTPPVPEPTPTPPIPEPTPTPPVPEPTPTPPIPEPTPTPPVPEPTPTPAVEPTPTPPVPAPTPTPPIPEPRPTPPIPEPRPTPPVPAATPSPIFNPVPEPDTSCGCAPLPLLPPITFTPPQPSPILNFDSNATQLIDIQNTNIGTPGNDSLTGNETNQLFLSFGGDDTVLGEAGSDIAFGDQQRDYIAAG